MQLPNRLKIMYVVEIKFKTKSSEQTALFRKLNNLSNTTIVSYRMF